ncbi:hypothetical protein KCP73_11120 [Salmonella enterica subsp. enterica]|nr:hypothetical protein KCP73_11120 [Salmonella enterica subsp. enterica]
MRYSCEPLLGVLVTFDGRLRYAHYCLCRQKYAVLYHRPLHYRRRAKRTHGKVKTKGWHDESRLTR